MTDAPARPASRRRPIRSADRGFLYRGIRIVPSYPDDARSVLIEAGMRDVGVRLGIVAAEVGGG